MNINPDPWEIYHRTLKDAYLPRVPIQFIVKPILELPSLNIWYSDPGTLKSFFLADLSICVAGNLVFLPPAPWKPGGRSFEVIQFPVMWLDFDNGKRRTDDRFEALARCRNLPDDIPLHYYSMPSPWLNAGDKAQMGELINRVNALGVKLVTIDNLGVVKGEAKEISDDMTPIMSLFRQLAEDTGAAVNLIHHKRKLSTFKGREGDNIRGHSSIEAAVDLSLWVDRESNSDTITVQTTKTRGADIDPFSGVFTFEHKPGTTDLLEARFFSIPVQDNQSTKAIEAAIIAALQNTELNKTGLKTAVKIKLPNVGINRISDVIDQAAADTKIQLKQGKRAELIYFL